jgi:dienelactone hydrolase
VIPGKLITEEFMLPAEFKNADGSTYVAHLDTLVIRPDDGKPHPLAVISHGTSVGDHAHIYTDESQAQTIEFARRGWTAVTFTRRGFGRSEGEYDETARKCDHDEYTRVDSRGGQDIREVIRLMSQKPYVDASTVIAVGVSGGGGATIALTAEPPPGGLKAAIAFAPGFSRTVVCRQDFENHTLGLFGRASRTPMLWVYAQNDRVVPEDEIRRDFRIFNKVGGKAEFLYVPSFQNDGHDLFSREGIGIWTRYVDDFLAKQGLKQTDGLIAADDVYNRVPNR